MIEKGQTMPGVCHIKAQTVGIDISAMWRIHIISLLLQTNSGWKIYFCDISFQFRQFLKMFPHLIYQGNLSLILRQQGRVGELVHLQYFTTCMDICFDNISLPGYLL